MSQKTEMMSQDTEVRRQEKGDRNEYVRQVAEQKYEFCFTTDVHT